MKITFDFSAKRVSINGDGPELVQILTLVRDLAPSLPSISIETVASEERPNAPSDGNASSAANPAGSGSGTPSTMRQFVRSLTLGSISEKVAAIAFYQLKHLQKTTFAPKEMSDWFTQCGLEKPGQMAVAVYDAKKKNGFVDNAGHGSWKISTQGENLIIRKLEEASEAKSAT